MSATALTIAGSDSGGGAGIQADLKTFSALGVYGCSVITALTAQNTLGVQGVLDVSPNFIKQQLTSVFSDLTIHAVKIGMLSQSSIIETVSNTLKEYSIPFIVVDPVMVATSGDILLQNDAINTLKTELIPQADMITPNLPEAAVLLNCKIPHTVGDMLKMMDPLITLGARTVLLKGGHLEGHEMVDLFYDGKTLHRFNKPKINTPNTHGTGCTLSSAVAALIATGKSLQCAVEEGLTYVAEAIACASQLHIGHGHGPVHHFYRQDKNVTYPIKSVHHSGLLNTEKDRTPAH
ncbi:Hydroxymethylpyrimidine/phosphomethylpyrimidine kinase [invertebrate metagenome]|uniref:Hydroxymethylpyrimidine/phosphomethylpyrimidine kinase n=1 Tax=invertebrate metagenome TaxID=1711999 RepID=A0A2H9T7G9_9ZZZZ